MQLPISVLMTSFSFPLTKAGWGGVFMQQMLLAHADFPQAK
jgi:hypothetical protein